jgi:hypothetical protein
MKTVRFFAAFMFAAMVIGTANAGRNTGATVEIDWDASTPQIEHTCGAGDEIDLAVRVSGAVDLAGYFIRLEFDTSKVRFIEVTKQIPGESAFIESSGGKPGPFLIVPSTNGTVEFAAGIVRADAAHAPDGNGTLLYARFSRKSWDGNCPVKLSTVQLSDIDLKVDTIFIGKK